MPADPKPRSSSRFFLASPRVIAACSLLGITLLVGLASLSPRIAEAWQFDRSALAAGELWRLLTGHLTHWNFDHLVWDLVAFLGLTVVSLRYSIRNTIGCVLASALAISGAIWLWQPEILVYRGLSGIDSALFAMLAVTMLVEAYRASDRLVLWATSAALLGLASKVVYELLTGQTLFVDSAAAGFIPLASAHACGAMVGIVIAIVSETKSSLVNPLHRSTLATNHGGLVRTDG